MRGQEKSYSHGVPNEQPLPANVLSSGGQDHGQGKFHLQTGKKAQPIPSSVLPNEGQCRQHSQRGKYDHASLQHQQGIPPPQDFRHNHEL